MPRLGAVKPETVLHITLKYYLCGDATATTGPDTVACGESPEGDGLWILQSELLALFLWKLDGLPSASLDGSHRELPFGPHYLLIQNSAQTHLMGRA